MPRRLLSGRYAHTYVLSSRSNVPTSSERLLNLKSQLVSAYLSWRLDLADEELLVVA